MNYFFFKMKPVQYCKALSPQDTQIKKRQRFFFRRHPKFKSSNHKNKERHRQKDTDGDNVSPVCAPAGKWVLWNTRKLEAETGTPGH